MDTLTIILLVVLVVLIAIVVGLFWWWRYYKHNDDMEQKQSVTSFVPAALSATALSANALSANVDQDPINRLKRKIEEFRKIYLNKYYNGYEFQINSVGVQDGKKCSCGCNNVLEIIYYDSNGGGTYNKSHLINKIDESTSMRPADADQNENAAKTILKGSYSYGKNNTHPYGHNCDYCMERINEHTKWFYSQTEDYHYINNRGIHCFENRNSNKPYISYQPMLAPEQIPQVEPILAPPMLQVEPTKPIELLNNYFYGKPDGDRGEYRQCAECRKIITDNNWYYSLIYQDDYHDLCYQKHVEYILEEKKKSSDEREKLLKSAFDAVKNQIPSDFIYTEGNNPLVKCKICSQEILQGPYFYNKNDNSIAFHLINTGVNNSRCFLLHLQNHSSLPKAPMYQYQPDLAKKHPDQIYEGVTYKIAKYTVRDDSHIMCNECKNALDRIAYIDPKNKIRYHPECLEKLIVQSKSKPSIRGEVFMIEPNSHGFMYKNHEKSGYTITCNGCGKQIDDVPWYRNDDNNEDYHDINDLGRHCYKEYLIHN